MAFINLQRVDDRATQQNFDEISLRWRDIQPIWDSGWFAAEANTAHATVLTHSLNLDLRNPPGDVAMWFSPTDPTGAAVPATIFKKSFLGMSVDDPVAAGMGYSNPAGILINQNTITLYFFAPIPLHSYYAASTGTWVLYQTGWLRLRMLI